MIHDVAWHTMTFESGKICSGPRVPLGERGRAAALGKTHWSGGCFHMLWERWPWGAYGCLKQWGINKMPEIGVPLSHHPFQWDLPF